MGIITKIEQQKNNENRANLYIDDKFFSGISIELVMKNHLKKGEEISSENLENLIFEDDKGIALSRAVKYISSNLKTQKQIEDYLFKKGYNESVINFVCDKLIEYKYIDDYAYSKAYILTYSSKYGKLKLEMELKNRGVNPNTIEDVFENVQPLDSCEKVAIKYLKNKKLDINSILKLKRFLSARGYSFDDINRVIDKFKED